MVDLKAELDSVDRDALWLFVLSAGLPLMSVDLIKAVYTDTLSHERADS